MNVLLIDDDVELADGLQRFLSINSIQCEAVTSVDAAEAMLRSKDFDAILLDVMLPDQNGLEFLPFLKTLTSAPVFMLTALGEETDRVTGLNQGADDYITKPFSAKELVARLNAVQRRLGPNASGITLRHDDIHLFPSQLKAKLDEKSIDLTGAECQLLVSLIRAPDNTASRDTLSRLVLGRDASPMDRSLDVHISNLRKKLGSHPVKGNRIRSLRGRGYVLAQ